MTIRTTILFAMISVPLVMAFADGQFKPNYDESQVPRYELPDPLRTSSGQPVDSARIWKEVRRPEILQLFETEMYGRSPQPSPAMSFKVTSTEPQALGGKAIRKEVTVYLAGAQDGPQMNILIYLPQVTHPAPLFLGLNFQGNHAIHADPGITLSQSWMRPGAGIVDHRATEATRGANASQWPVEKILGAGFGLATIYYGDIDPDYDDGFMNGVHPAFYAPGQTEPGPAEWGSIGAWAWGLSRALDYLETDRDVNAQRVAVIGHSRLGKTALWAGATDPRFALIISNNSGCGGAALSKRQFGETVGRINAAFPHWFCRNFTKYNNKEQDLPLDQHMLIALIAPRPVYVASAVEDTWADPRGEFLAVHHAEPVYKLLGAAGLGATDMPAVDQPLNSGSLGYHIRRGVHDVTDYDWDQYLAFAARHFAAARSK